MKILIISDSHGRLDKIMQMYELENPDIVFCAGDYSKDGEELSFVYPGKCYIVRGNCDIFDRRYSDEMIIELEGVKILLAHGHEYGVKSSYDSIEKRTKILKCDIAVFGHTHVAFNKEINGTRLFNPGAAKDGEYGILIIDKSGYRLTNKSIY